MTYPKVHSFVLSNYLQHHPMRYLFGCDGGWGIWVSWKRGDSHDAWSWRYLLVGGSIALQTPSFLQLQRIESRSVYLGVIDKLVNCKHNLKEVNKLNLYLQFAFPFIGSNTADNLCLGIPIFLLFIDLKFVFLEELKNRGLPCVWDNRVIGHFASKRWGLAGSPLRLLDPTHAEKTPRDADFLYIPLLVRPEYIYKAR